MIFIIIKKKKRNLLYIFFIYISYFFKGKNLRDQKTAKNKKNCTKIKNFIFFQTKNTNGRRRR